LPLAARRLEDPDDGVVDFQFFPSCLLQRQVVHQRPGAARFQFFPSCLKEDTEG